MRSKLQEFMICFMIQIPIMFMWIQNKKPLKSHLSKVMYYDSRAFASFQSSPLKGVVLSLPLGNIQVVCLAFIVEVCIIYPLYYLVKFCYYLLVLFCFPLTIYFRIRWGHPTNQKWAPNTKALVQCTRTNNIPKWEGTLVHCFPQ